MTRSFWGLLPNSLQVLFSGGEAVLRAVKINQLTTDSREVQSGTLFCALPGTQVDGRQFIPQAQQQGAAVILVNANEDQIDEPLASLSEGIVYVQDLARWVGEIAAAFYGHPSRAIQVVGVTGTNGKTTTSFLLASLAQELGIDAGVMGTNGYGRLDCLKPQLLTTPGPIQLQAQLAQLRDEGLTLVVMEVSSHALDQQRVSGCEFYAAVFTNLSRDHMDYHGDLASYAAAKKKLLTWPGLQHVIANTDDQYGLSFLQESSAQKKWSYSASTSAKLQGTTTATFDVLRAGDGEKLQLDITEIAIQIDRQSAVATTQLVGQFNFYNMLASIVLLHSLDFSLADIVQKVPNLVLPSGRMQRVSLPKESQHQNAPYVIVDFAHTPDAIQVVLDAVQGLVSRRGGRLITVFGCGGDRDRGKRAQMAEAVQKKSNQVSLTSDNPRFELLEQIFSDVRLGFVSHGAPVTEFVSRADAIQKTVLAATAQDVVIILGKGHEKYQEIKGVRSPFDDVAVAQAALVLWLERCNVNDAELT